MKEERDRVDDEGTKQIEQFVSFAEFVRPQNWKNQNWVCKNLPAAILSIHRDVQLAVEHHQNDLTSAVAAS